MKVYAKIRQNGEYHSQAVYGFREMGAEIVRYQKISDIYESVTKEDIVLDYITQVEMILKKFGVVPACEDYPVELRKFMGRNVWKDTINSINTHPEKWGVFVKPVKSKAFTGHVIRSSKDLIGCGRSTVCTVEAVMKIMKYFVAMLSLQRWNGEGLLFMMNW